MADKRGGGVLIALRENITYNRLTASKNNPNWSDRLEIIVLELEMMNTKKSLVSVCYRPPNCNLNEWLELFKAILNDTSHYDKILITGDFNFPDLTWNSSLPPNISERTPSVGSSEFRPRLWEKFRELRRSAKTLIQAKRTEYFRKLPSLLKSGNKKFWSLFKSISNYSNIPAKMSWYNQDSTSSTADNPFDIADMLNRSSTRCFKLPTLIHNQLSSVDFEDDMIDLTTISDLTLTEGEVRYVLRNIDEEKATGPDKIPAVLLKKLRG